jgi:hypothetical protein
VSFDWRCIECGKKKTECGKQVRCCSECEHSWVDKKDVVARDRELADKLVEARAWLPALPMNSYDARAYAAIANVIMGLRGGGGKK